MKIDLSSNKPVITILTVMIALICVIVGGVVTITNPQSLSFHQYITDIAFVGGALGLGAGIGRGIDSNGQAQAAALEQAQPDPVYLGGNVAPDVPVDEVNLTTSPQSTSGQLTVDQPTEEYDALAGHEDV
jgi:hypothetical protein